MAVISAAIPVKYRRFFNAGIPEKTLTIFSVIILATSGSLFFPVATSHSEQQLFKTKKYELWHKIWKCAAKKNIVRIITVGNFELATPANFLLSWLVIIRSMTLAGLFCAGAISESHHCRKNTKNLNDFPETSV